jgi:hypothetical protein
MTDKPVYPSTKRYARRKANGDSQYPVWLSPASQAHLKGLQGDSVTVEQAVAAALLLAHDNRKYYRQELDRVRTSPRSRQTRQNSRPA